MRPLLGADRVAVQRIRLPGNAGLLVAYWAAGRRTTSDPPHRLPDCLRGFRGLDVFPLRVWRPARGRHFGLYLCARLGPKAGADPSIISKPILWLSSISLHHKRIDTDAEWRTAIVSGMVAVPVLRPRRPLLSHRNGCVHGRGAMRHICRARASLR